MGSFQLAVKTFTIWYGISWKDIASLLILGFTECYYEAERNPRLRSVARKFHHQTKPPISPRKFNLPHFGGSLPAARRPACTTRARRCSWARARWTSWCEFGCGCTSESCRRGAKIKERDYIWRQQCRLLDDSTRGKPPPPPTDQLGKW